MKDQLDYQAEMLAAKIKHYLITTMGRVSDEAVDEEFYRAFSYALREEIMINWLASTQTAQQKDVRTLYYLSMEYLPGRILSNNFINIGALDIVRLVMEKMNRNFSEIISKEPDPGLGNGGLGRLASCFLDSLATQHYPAVAYGLRYQYGIFEQQIRDREQIEAPDTWLLNENPWEFRRDLKKVFVKFGGRMNSSTNIHGDQIYFLNDYEGVGALPFDIPIVGYSNEPNFSVISLRLWSTKESPRNFQLQRYNAGRLDQAAENTTLTDVLYPSDHHETGKRIRLKQEYLLVSASLQDIIRQYLSTHTHFREFADKVRIQINDTHPTLVIPELIRLLTQTYDLPWKTAVEIAQTVTGYTNHTVLSEALEVWDQNLFQYLLPRQYKIIERLNQEFCNSLRQKQSADEELVRHLSIIENGQVRMANLAIVGSHSVNGVAELHSDILKKRVFKEFYTLFPNKFFNVTNGVTQRRWLLHSNPDLAHFITGLIGDKWVTNFSEIYKLREFANKGEVQDEFLLIKKKNKERLIDFIQHNLHIRNKQGEIVGEFPIIDPNSLFDMQIKRIHEYKRQTLNLLHIIMLYNEILANPHTTRIKRTFFFAGKAAAGYVIAKQIIHAIHCVAEKINKDPAVKGLIKILFIENYNVSRAELLIPAADLSEQISTAGMEASGTGNMKLSINGALTIGTDDGANIEMREEVTQEWWPFSFGCSAEEILEMQQSFSYNPWEICSNDPEIRTALERLIDGTFASTEADQQALVAIHDKLLNGSYGEMADRFFVLKDLRSYYDTQLKVEELYKQPHKWAEYALHNITMGKFSTDRSIHEYAKNIWGIKPCEPDPEILERVRHEYSEHDKCRIY